MDITLSKDQIAVIGVPSLADYGYSEDNLRYKRELTVDLSAMTQARARKFRQLLAAHPDVKGIQVRLRDIDTWLALLDGAKVKCRRIRDFDSMLKQYLKTAPDHWIYSRREPSEVWQPYYVPEIRYHPPQRREGWTVPAFVTVGLCWEELGEIHRGSIRFHAEDVVGKSAGVALADAGYVIQTPVLREAYEKHKAHYDAIHDKIGLQFTAVGVAEEAEDEGRKKKSYWSGVDTIRLDRHGEPARVVVDILKESDKDKPTRDDHPSASFWGDTPSDHEGDEADSDREIGPGDEDEDQELQAPRAAVPLKPALICFDLKRHTRLHIYVDQLTEYQYQTDLADKLILPSEVRGLVDLLVAHKGGFRDIVGGKGGGAIILCAGRPGTGKTLTSEVYSESMRRPLYTVQCSQLGTDADELEKNLLLVFRRAIRWNAILLLDEADVYVAARGSDLQQNAIVGVFLRVLEYYAGVMFLTTNRADLVDDAVASRCLARIDYKIPTPADQARIWRTLADTAGVTVSDREIDRIVDRHPKLSGRDVKNLLKLAAMVSEARNEKVTADTVDYVKQFKPTIDDESGQEE